MSSSNPLLKSIADQFFNLHVCSLFTVSGYCLLIYDWLLTFPDEVNYMWNGRLTTVRALYFFNRYTAPLVSTPAHRVLVSCADWM
ncbi:hypothetical protein SISSUDRAFT_864055 [Sistotremastrum suecicum HHB10207 ss-3]|uniref:DUF6533 domain-containing protein n=1 Tax=Sistotremastrum suecicum HHB10207 ss-3 TaxID=1314776 RepID=A0A166CFJ2_9AGAM|nr:hypothetical protein SISSUDRAFT_864055 [Sistotremastrum suecicum HHB10207 ss-3]